MENIIRFFDNIVYSGLQKDTDSSFHYQIKRINLAIISLVICVPFFSSIYYYLDVLQIAAGTLTVGLLAVICLFWFRKSKNITFSANFILLIYALLIILSTVYLGGINSSTLWWNIHLPILAILLINIRWGIFWTIFIISEVILIEVLTISNKFPASLLSGIELIYHDLITKVVALTLLSFFGALFILEREYTIKKLKAALEKEKKLDYAKNEFIAIASHNLRTPLMVLRGNLENLEQNQPSSKEVKERFSDINVALHQLIKLSEELLMIASLELEKQQIITDSKDLVKITKSVIVDYMDKAKNKGIKLIFKPNTEGRYMVKVDESKLRMVIDGLIDNAVKYTVKGGVEVEISKEAENYKLTVKDSGSGISKEYMEQLFTKFQQAKRSYLEFTPGEGLTLYLAKLIVESHGGKMGVKSEKDVGSEFWFTIPNGAKS